MFCDRVLEQGELTKHVKDHDQYGIRPPLFVVDLPETSKDD